MASGTGEAVWYPRPTGWWSKPMNKLTTDILVVGGGAAGLSAALAASENAARVTLVDDNPQLGGQIWRAEMGRIKTPAAKRLIEAVNKEQIEIVAGTQVFGTAAENRLLAETSGGTVELEFDKLIIATGARERFLPFHNWTGNNVFGAAGLQALVKGGMDVKGKRIVVAGTGPLLFAVAAYLKSKGARILAIVEQAPAAKVNRFAWGLWRYPTKLFQAIALRTRLIRTRYLTDCWVTSYADWYDLAGLVQNGRHSVMECDMLACGFDLVPNIELAGMLGCKIEDGRVVVDEFQLTSCENIFCAGEPTGIGGVDASLAEGQIAGYAATGNELEARGVFADRERAARFAEKLNSTFALRDELRVLAQDSDIVCRCEDVKYAQLKHFDSFRDAKLQTRCGMGPCQGRICGIACEFIFGWESAAVRPPIFPVKLENL